MKNSVNKIIRDVSQELNEGYQYVTCPVCGNLTLDSYYICEHCKWEYDSHAIKDDSYSDINNFTVKEYRNKFNEGYFPRRSWDGKDESILIEDYRKRLDKK